VDRFAFEAYNEPVGGVLDKDTSGTTVAFMSKFVQQAYRGVLQVLRPPLHLPTHPPLPSLHTLERSGSGELTGSALIAQ